MKNFNIRENCWGNSYDDAVPAYTDPHDIEDKDSIVTKRKKIQIVFDYPLTDPVTFSFTTRCKKGWTRKALFCAIRQGYRKIYQNDEKYGVWGHCMEDLVIEGVRQNKRGGKFSLDMGS